jgi:outer membrane protein insertion porin family
MIVRTLALLLLLAPTQEFAQTHSPKAARKAAVKKAAPAEWPIESLSVEGNQNYTKEQILGVAGLKVGQMAGKSQFDAARDRLVATGVFETVSYRFAPAKDSDGYAATFQVVEAGPFYPVQFAGLPPKPAEIEAWLKSKNPMYAPKIPATTEVLARYTKLIEEFLATRNQSEKVIGKLTPTAATNEFAIVFRSTAPLATVAEVKFTGNSLFPATLLQNKISEVAIGVPYTESGFRALLDTAIRPRYDARGHVQVSFPKITTEQAKDVNGVVVTVVVDEGPEFKLGDVQIGGRYAAKSAELLKVAKFKTGEIANFDEVAQGLERIKKSLKRTGYLHAEAHIDRTVHEKGKTVDLTIRIDEGPQFTFGKLIVQGLDLNGEAEVKKLWGLQEGKPFDGDYPDYFLNRVQQDGIFDNLHKTKAQVNVDEEHHTVDVTLQFG